MEGGRYGEVLQKQRRNVQQSNPTIFPSSPPAEGNTAVSSGMSNSGPPPPQRKRGERFPLNRQNVDFTPSRTGFEDNLLIFLVI